MGIEYISSGVISSGLAVAETDLYVLSGGKIVDTNATEGFVQINTGGVESGTLYDSGAEGQIYGSSFGDLVVGESSLTVLSGGSATSETVGSLGCFVVAYGTATNTLVEAYGTVSVVSAATASNITLNDYGQLVVGGGAILMGNLILGAFDNVTAGRAISGNTEVISGFQSGDVISVGGFGSASTLSFVSGGGVLSAIVASGSVQEDFFFDGATSTSNIKLSASYFSLYPTSPNILTFNAELLTYIACFAAGTRILTVTGEQAVESIAVGKFIVVANNDPQPVRWIGRRSYIGRFLASNSAVWPIRFHAGSLGNGLPRRDLLVSPEHGLFIDGVLVPARCLVNGNTVVQERGLDRLDYFHIELDKHEVLLAEGTPAESFVDDGGRNAFQNAAEFAMLYSRQEQGPAVYCAPRIESGFELEAIRWRLAEVAEQIVAA